MEFRILGPLEVWDGGGGIAIPRRQQRVLLATLLIRAGEVVSVDRLVDDLWGDEPPAAAHGSLQNTVSQLRKVLGADVIRRQAPGYVLDVDRDAIDAHRFERLVASVSGLEAAERADVLREALALWRGPAFADLADEPCVAVEASRLDGERLDALEARIEAELALGRHFALVAQLEALTVEHPLREPLHGQLALALYRSGRQADALEAIATVRRTLDERGLELTQTLKQLERDILNHSPSVAAPTVAVEEEADEDAGERRLVSVLAADLPAEEDPERLRDLLRRVLAAATDAVGRHGGELERFGPDGLVAVFGADGSREDDALRAVRAAVELHESAGVPVGVATGDAVVGGEPRVTAGAVARAAGLARAHHGVLVGPRTLALVREAVTVEEAGSIARVLTVHPARPVPRDETPLVGRAEELARVRAALAVGPGAAFTVVGEAGIGKSRLARELVRSFDGAVLVGQCAAYGEGATFLPLREALRGVDLAAALTGSEDAELVATRIAALEGADRSPGTLGESYWAVRRLLESLAGVRPLLLVLDDVHWAEHALLDLVDYIDARVGETPLRILCLARPELLEARPGWAARSLALEPLGEEQTRELVSATAELEDEPRARIVELAEGNPLYAQQLAAYAAESGKALEPGAMPATIDAVLAGRLGRLDADERATLQRAAVVGRVFSRGAVAALAPPDLAVDAHLLALARRGFVLALPDPLPGDDAYRFHHGLLRDAAYAMLTKDQRADLHEKVAAWVDRGGTGEDGLVGYHLEQAAASRPTPELQAAAGERLGRAGYRAAARGDTHAAGALLERCVGLLPSGVRRGELFWELAIQRHVAGRADAHAALDDAAAEAKRHGDRRLEARVSAERAGWGLATGDVTPDEALGPVTEALAILEEADDARGQGRAWLAIGAVHNYRCEMSLMGEAAARAQACAETIGFSTAAAIGSRASALLYGPAPAADAIAECLELLDRAVDRAGRANVLAALGALHGMVGQFDRADDLLEGSRAAYAEVGLTLALHTSWSHAAFSVARLAGRASDAEAIARTSLEILLDLGEPAWAATRAVQLADLALDSGTGSGSAKMASLAKRHASKQDALVQFMLLRVQARLKARAGDASAAERLARRAVALSGRTDDVSARADTVSALAEVLLLAGRTDEAARAAAEADALYDSKGNVAGRDRAARLLGALQPA